MNYHLLELFTGCVFWSVIIAFCFFPWGLRLIERNRGTGFFFIALGVAFFGRLALFIHRGAATERYMLPIAVLLLALVPIGVAGICRIAHMLPGLKKPCFGVWILAIVTTLLCGGEVLKLIRIDRKPFIKEFAAQLMPYNNEDTLFIPLGDSGISILHHGPDKITLFDREIDRSSSYYEELFKLLPESSQRYQEIFVMFRGGKRSGDPAPDEFERVVKSKWSIFPFDLIAVSKTKKREYRLYRFNWKIGDGVNPVRRGKCFPAWQLDLTLTPGAGSGGEKIVDCRSMVREFIPESGTFRVKTIGRYTPSFGGKLIFMPGVEIPEKVVLDAEFCNELNWQTAHIRHEAVISSTNKVIAPKMIPEKVDPQFNAEICYDLFLPEKLVVPADGCSIFGCNFNPFGLSGYWKSIASITKEKTIPGSGERFDQVMMVKLIYPPLDYCSTSKVGIKFAPKARHCPRNLRILLVDLMPGMQENFNVALRDALLARHLPEWKVDVLYKKGFPDGEFGYNRLGDILSLTGERYEKLNKEYDLVLILPDDSDFNRRISWEDPQQVNFNSVFSSGSVDRLFRGVGAKAVTAIILPWQCAPGLVNHFPEAAFSGGVRKNTICARLSGFVRELNDPRVETLFLPPVFDPDADYMINKDEILAGAGCRYLSSQRLSPAGVDKLAGAVVDWAMEHFSRK